MRYPSPTKLRPVSAWSALPDAIAERWIAERYPTATAIRVENVDMSAWDAFRRILPDGRKIKFRVGRDNRHDKDFVEYEVTP